MKSSVGTAGHEVAELAVGTVWGVVGYLFLRWMLTQARRRAALQLM